ncbi:MAG: hypothetical protein A2X23_08950 [Chloroflexi bacterium GWC2_73_18]|nr:MAG: hypothetical protein A2X23_08950 [Chloroflexi bacterium GWC2_73_18]
MGGQPGVGLAIPGAMAATVGLVLLYQTRTAHWESWAYAWALIAPGSVGLGLFLYGLLTAQWRVARSGVPVMAAGLGLFLAGVVFFEGILGIGGRRIGQEAQLLLAAAVIGLGALFVVGALLPRSWRSATGPAEGWGPERWKPGRGAGLPGSGWSSGGPQPLAFDLAGATQAEVQLDFGAGRLAVGPAATGHLLDGIFEGGVRHEVAPGGRVRLWPDVPWVGWGWRRHEWQVGLTTEVPLRLHLATGAAEAELDLTEHRLAELQLRTGASQTRIGLPRAAGYTRVEAEGGAASVRFRVPEGVAARSARRWRSARPRSTRSASRPRPPAAGPRPTTTPRRTRSRSSSAVGSARSAWAERG